MNNDNLGLVHIYCGDGKGKTTASVGLTVRAVGYGLNVLFMQFLKDGDSNELKVLKTLDGIDIMTAKPIKKFTFMMNEEELAETKAVNNAQIQEIVKLTGDGKYNLLVMDECLGAIEAGVLDESKVFDFLDNKPEDLEVVITGRVPSEEMMKRANYVSKVMKIKHPYDEGIPARKGIEK